MRSLEGLKIQENYKIAETLGDFASQIGWLRNTTGTGKVQLSKLAGRPQSALKAPDWLEASIKEILYMPLITHRLPTTPVRDPCPVDRCAKGLCPSKLGFVESAPITTFGPLCSASALEFSLPLPLGILLELFALTMRAKFVVVG